MEKTSLAGRRIAIPETRELDVFAAMLERRGASVLRCPLISIKDAPDPQPVLNWIRDFNTGKCDDLILLTGEGLRRLLSCIEQHEPALSEAFLTQLARVRKITRGPKPAKALRELGLKPELSAAAPTTEGVIATLQQHSLSGRRIGVQLYGTEPNLRLTSFLEQAGAQVHTVAPYIYADAADNQAVLGLVEQLAAGTVDVIAFTSSAQVDRLFAVGSDARAQAALARTQIAAIGPVVAESLRKRGIKVNFMPEASFFMKPLTTLLEQSLPARTQA